MYFDVDIKKWKKFHYKSCQQQSRSIFICYSRETTRMSTNTSKQKKKKKRGQKTSRYSCEKKKMAH